MKKLSLIGMGLVLLMAMTQCKKQETPSTNDNEGEKVHITLEVDNGSKNIIYPETGGAFFENGDKVLVANNGHYVGTLTYNSSNRHFDGDIEGAVESDYLHFYFMGNQPLTEGTPNGNTTSFTVNISDQTNCYPQIAYAPSSVKYAGEMAYKACLLNKCALVKFNTNEIPVETAVTVWGLNNTVSVNLSNNSFSFSKTNGGNITLHAESTTSRWAILLPQTIETTPTVTIPGYVSSMSLTTPMVIENNGYITSGLSVTKNNPALFTVDDFGTKVQFSQGNLQYQASTNIWRFATNQYDYIGSTNSNISSTYDGWIDLFGWGTSGYNHNNAAYQPWATSTSYNSYYAYGNSFYHLYDQTGQADWGYNPISNGGNTANQWRTLKNTEWQYVFNTRTMVSGGIRYAMAKVNNVNGVILLPDDWSSSTYSLNSGTINFSNNTLTVSQWSILEQAGAVFLPAAGYRNGVSINSNLTGNRGYYWSSSSHDATSAYRVYFYNAYLTQTFGDRFCGYSVRLVRNAQ